MDEPLLLHHDRRGERRDLRVVHHPTVAPRPRRHRRAAAQHLLPQLAKLLLLLRQLAACVPRALAKVEGLRACLPDVGAQLAQLRLQPRLLLLHLLGPPQLGKRCRLC